MSVLIPDSPQMKRASPASKSTEAELMNNPWNAMYNDRVGGMGGGWAERAEGPDVQKWNKLADQYRWEAKFLPGGSYTGGSNPFAWVESVSTADADRAKELERQERQHHADLINMRKGGFLKAMSAAEVKANARLSPEQAKAEAIREARCKELDKKLGVDQVVLDPMKLQIDTTAWGVIAAQDAKRGNKSYDANRHTSGVRLEKTNTATSPSTLPRARDKPGI